MTTFSSLSSHLKSIIYLIFRIFSIQKNKILFFSYYGEQYGCNPKYISEYISSKSDFWKCIWAFTKPNKHQTRNIKKCKYNSIRFYIILSRCKIIITNYRMPINFKKRSGQIYIQTWHSMLRLKKIEKDVEFSLSKNYIDMAKHDSNQIDLLLSGCKKSSQIFRDCFWYNKKILESGSPRCDIFFYHNSNLASIINHKLGTTNKKILLYAPTFRNGHSTDCYDIDFINLLSQLNSTTNEHWIILIRLHPHLSSLSTRFANLSEDIIDVTNYDDVQELMLVSDVLITDYSSLMFDYLLSKKLCVLYVPDIDNFQETERTLYFNLEELPFPKCTNQKELCNIITSKESINEYVQKSSCFLKMVGSNELGHSSQNVLEFLDQNYRD